MSLTNFGYGQETVIYRLYHLFTDGNALPNKVIAVNAEFNAAFWPTYPSQGVDFDAPSIPITRPYVFPWAADHAIKFDWPSVYISILQTRANNIWDENAILSCDAYVEMFFAAPHPDKLHSYARRYEAAIRGLLQDPVNQSMNPTQDNLAGIIGIGEITTEPLYLLDRSSGGQAAILQMTISGILVQETGNA